MPKQKKIIATEAGLESDYKAGLKRPRVITGKVDPEKARLARIATTTSGMGRERTAGMMIDFIHMSAPYASGYKLDTYRSSYAFGLGDRTGAYDIPTYFLMMNQQNGGLLYWPVTLAEKYSWYRYWSRTDAYVARSLELLSDLPMSKLTLNMPRMPKQKKELQKEILEFFTYQMEVLNLFELCQDILWEWNMIGNCYVFHEWDDDKKMWSRAVMLPPEEVYIFQYPFSENRRVEYRPERLIRMMKDGAVLVAGQSALADSTSSLTCARGDLEQKILEHIPEEIVEMVRTQGCIVMDSDPTTGSFVHHFARRRSRYLDLGASVLERVLVQMLCKENFRYTQLSLATRNMTPKNLITAPGLMPTEVDELRTQVDLSYMDPEYSIITNYEVNWQQIGTTDRLLDLDREYERLENQVFAGLGVTRELLTGEGTFGGSKITVEILNTMFLMTRELIKSYIEKKLFIPICEAHGWYETGKNGIKKYLYPQVGFNRLTIRDNTEVFDSLFQLYQKGSLPVDIMYELFNLNVDEINAKLRNQLFTVKDATSNRLSEEVNAEVGRKLVDLTDIVPRVAKYLGLKMKSPEEQQQAQGMGGMGGGFADIESPAGTPPTGTQEGVPVGPAEGEVETEAPEEESEPAPTEEESSKSPEELDEMADAVSKSMPSNFDDGDIEKIVEKVSEKEGEKKASNGTKKSNGANSHG